jgi:DNA-binding response OmpR family regulator
MTKPCILIVDDDDDLTGMVCRYLLENGMEAEAVQDSVAMDRWLAMRQPELVVLDVMLPGEDGLSIIRRLKSHSATRHLPVLMLSARGSDVDRIIGLEMGADDYLGKPFNPRELLARIRARLRESTAPEAVDTLAAGCFELDLARRVARKDGEVLDLSTADFALLRILLSHANRVVSRSQLVDLAQGAERLPFERSIDVRVTRLRKKIETDPACPHYLRTVWGSGYLFVPDGSDGS